MSLINALLQDIRIFFGGSTILSASITLAIAIFVCWVLHVTVDKKSSKGSLWVHTTIGYGAVCLLFMYDCFSLGVIMFALSTFIFASSLKEIPLINKAKLILTVNRATGKVTSSLREMDDKEVAERDSHINLKEGKDEPKDTTS